MSFCRVKECVCLLEHTIKIDRGIFRLSRKNEKKQESGILLVGKPLVWQSHTESEGL
jgi:hypothetical protein